MSMLTPDDFKIPTDTPEYDTIAQAIQEGRFKISKFGPTLVVFDKDEQPTWTFPTWVYKVRKETA